MALYMQHLPPAAKLEKSLWFVPLKAASRGIQENPGTWYKNCPIGENTLKTFVKDLMKTAGYSGNYSNHSLRVTTVNRLIDAGLSDGDIMNRTGHRSSTTIANYRRVNESNAGAASTALATTSNDSSKIDEQNAELVKFLESLTDADFEDLDDNEEKDTKEKDSATEAQIPPRFDLSISQMMDGSIAHDTQTDMIIPPNARVTYTVIG
jgi:hypothetical protein